MITLNIPKICAVTAVVLLSLVVLPLVLKLTLRRYKNELAPPEELKTAMAVWTSSLFLALAIVWTQMLSVALEALNIILKTEPGRLLMAFTERISVFFAIGVAWYALLFWAAKGVCALIPMRRNAKEEMELDGVGYFLVRGAVLVGLAVSLLTVEELALRVWMAGVGVPYFH